MFLNNYILIQKQRVKDHVVVPHMLQLNILFAIMTWHLLIRQLFYHYKTFTSVQILSSLFWSSFQNFKISLLKWKTIRWIKFHHQQNGIYKKSSVQNVYLRKSGHVVIEAHGKIIYDQDKNTIVYHFKVGYMTHPILKNIGHRNKRLSIFLYGFQVKQFNQSNNCWQKKLSVL